MTHAEALRPRVVSLELEGSEAALDFRLEGVVPALAPAGEQALNAQILRVRTKRLRDARYVDALAEQIAEGLSAYRRAGTAVTAQVEP